jgi:hypothetical protein
MAIFILVLGGANFITTNKINDYLPGGKYILIFQVQ